MYPNIRHNYLNQEWLTEWSILVLTNEIINEINQQILQQIPEEEIIFTSIDTLINIEDNINYPPELINLLQPLTKRCNGTRLIIKSIFNNIIKATIITGHFKGTVAVCFENFLLR